MSRMQNAPDNQIFACLDTALLPGFHPTTKLSFSFCPKLSRKEKMSSYLNWTICGSLDISCSNKLFCFVATNLQLLWWPLNRGLVSGLVGMSRYPSIFHTNEEIFSFLLEIFSGVCEKKKAIIQSDLFVNESLSVHCQITSGIAEITRNDDKQRFKNLTLTFHCTTHENVFKVDTKLE